MRNLETHASVSVPNPRDPAGELSVSVPVEFIWSDDDPLALTMFIFNDPNDVLNAVVWTFALDLMREGILHRAGEGDVVVYPTNQDIVVILRSPDGTCQLVFYAEKIVAYLAGIPNVKPDLSELDDMFRSEW